MQTHLYKQNSITQSKRNLSSISILFALVIVAVSILAMTMIPGYLTYSICTLTTFATLRQLALVINKKPLLLQITNNEIIYLSEERNELITINSTDIMAIDHKFCELLIHTKDESVHRINLLNTKSEQTRWEIKELVRCLTAKITR